MRVAIPFTGIDASGAGYGRTRTCPDFGAGYAAYMFGTLLTDTPTKNLFTNVTDGRLVGTPSTIGLIHGPMTTSFTGAISGSVLTVSGTVVGDPLAVGMTVELNTAAGSSLGVISSFGTGTGGTGTYNLTGAVATSGTMMATTRFFEVPGTSQSIFNVGNAVTLLAIFKSTTAQGILADTTGGGNMAMLIPGASDVQTFGRDSASVVINVSTSSGFTNGATTWSMGVSNFTTTSGQGFIQRSGPARAASAAATTRTANPVGSTTRKLRTGYYTTSTPSSQLVGLAIYTKVLSSTEMDDAFLYWRDLLADVGEVL